MAPGVTLIKGGKEVVIPLAGADGSAEMRSLLDPVSAERHSQAMNKIHSLVCVRERCASEVLERLIDSEFTYQEAHDAVERAIECGLISHERYASAFIKGKLHKGWSAGKIVNSLKAKGLSTEEIYSSEELLPDSNSEFENALAELRRKKTFSSNPRRALLNRLAYRGYSSDVAIKAVEAFLAE